MVDDLSALVNRPGWTVDGPIATFAPGTGWRAVVRSVRLPGKTYSLWHIALVEGSTARHVLRAHDLDQAVRVAEAQINARGESFRGTTARDSQAR